MTQHKAKARISGWLGAALLLVSSGAAAQARDAAVEVAGEVAKPGPLTLAALEKMTAETVTWSHHGERHEVTGVPLGKILTAMGFTPGAMSREMAPADKRPGYKKVLLVTARDGFQAVFSCAEVAEQMGATRALLVWKVDGKPLSAEHGPFRLVVTSDQEPSRSVYAVARLEVVDPRPRATVHPTTR